MQVFYNSKSDLLYLRLDDRKQQVVNQRLSEGIILDIGEDHKILGIEILDASNWVNLESLLPIKHEVISDAG